MYVLAVKAKVHLHKQQEFLQVLRSLQINDGNKEGATNLELIEDMEDQTSYSLIDRWETEEELAKYLCGEKYKVLLGALQVLCKESVVQYKLIPDNRAHHLDPMLNSAN